jgi:homoserine kinase
MAVRVTVPASSANLGPGFDTFGLALALRNEIEGELAEAWSVEVHGEGAGRLSAGPDNQVARAAQRVFAEARQRQLAARIVCRNGIPVGRGLGSSAAAIVGGLVLADALAGANLGRTRLLQIAGELEGHSDNVAAALYGGFTVTSTRGERALAAHVQPAAGLAAVVVLGEQELPTHLSRAALPETVPHADAAATGSHAALVALGIALGVPAYLHAGLRDAIHEPYREDLVPDMAPVRSLLEGIGAGPVVLSGAGPTMLALVPGSTDTRALERARALADVARPSLADLGRHTVLALPVDRTGAVIS